MSFVLPFLTINPVHWLLLQAASAVADARERELVGGGLGLASYLPIRDDVDVRMMFEDIEFEQSTGGGLLGAGAVGSVYRAQYRVRA